MRPTPPRSPRSPRAMPAASPRPPAPPPRAAAVRPPASAAAPDVRAILFDMDGVLTLSEDLSREVGARVMHTLYGIPDVDPAEFIPFVGQGEAVFLSGVARARGVQDIDIPVLKQAFFDGYIAALGEPGVHIGAPGARNLVRACRAAGLKTAVASAADLVKAEANLANAGFSTDLGVDFDAIVTADAFEKLKPAPDVFLAAAKALATPPAHCVVIEDAPAGVAAARAAGMRVLGVCTTLTRDQMRAQGPDDVAADTSEVSVERLVGLVDSTAV